MEYFDVQFSFSDCFKHVWVLDDDSKISVDVKDVSLELARREDRETCKFSPRV